MTAWETEDELCSAAVATLPTPSDTPYRTPSRTSRRSRRSTTPPGISSSPPPLPPGDWAEKSAKRSSKDVTMNESFSILDPRRFTPTLHANLVSEILALRRDQEDKLKIIESLEETLHTTREEQETLQTDLSNTTKESRSLKRQLALLEGGTSTAMGDLVRERDEAVETLTETKKRLETSQKKLKTQEEDSQRVHDLWAKERDDWEEERRKYERKLHVAESRLKAVLDEVAAFQASQMSGANQGAEAEEEEAGRENDAASVRSMSMRNSVQYSTMSSGIGKINGHSLADELNFDDDSDSQTDIDGRQSAFSIRHTRNFSRDSVFSKTHARNQSIESQVRPGSVVRGRLYMNSTVPERLEGGIREDDESQSSTAKAEYLDSGVQYSPPVEYTDSGVQYSPRVEYTDSGVQYSPPQSAKGAVSEPSTPERAIKLEKTMDIESPRRGEMEIEANQRRKRVQLAKPLPIESPVIGKLMVSSASQTVEDPLGPQRTPISPARPKTLPVAEDKPAPVRMASTAIQTDAAPIEPTAPFLAMPIPSISVIPPTSRSPTPQEHRLPQYVKDFGCQVSIIKSAQSTSTATQTEEIRIDKRLDKLPPHLHPSAISSRPVSPSSVAVEDSANFTPVPGNVPPRNPRRLATKRSSPEGVPSSPPAYPMSPISIESETRDIYPGNNDDGPLSNEKAPMRRPHRISSLFAGFEAESSEDGEAFDDIDGSDAEFRTALSAPKPKRGSGKKSMARLGSESPEQVRMVNIQPMSIAKQIVGGPEVYSSFNIPGGRDSTAGKSPKVLTSAADKSTTAGTASRVGAMRKTAMIQSGIASHQHRSPSPNLQDSQDPPFPIPMRASSRRPPISGSAPGDIQHGPPSKGGGSQRRGAKGSGVYRSNSIRKVRSAAAMPRNPRHRRQSSRSPPRPPPPPMSPSTEAPYSPSLSPLPSTHLTSPRGRDGGASRYRSHRSQPSTNTAYTDNTNMESAAGSSQQVSGVVDAIAQTMVGEWMFKYVRRRKSFSMADSTNRNEENSNDRHKRWVWLAPYERAILWSSKQPQSGSALMGKPGRKLTIQSVLDVKDDNPPPKGATQVFNRSILILTPERALKFTATTAERHYLWLTALSFLAHSQHSVPDILPTSPAPRNGAPELDAPRIRTKRGGIRDSIRLTKGKNPAMALQAERTIEASQLDEALTSFKSDTFTPTPIHHRDLSIEAAEPPIIPRFHGRVDERANHVVLHGRKRSNTGGHVPPPLSFRGFSSPTGPSNSYHTPSNSTAGNSVGTGGISDIYQASSNMTWGQDSVVSQRTSEASSRPPMNGNFFEAIGTVRMEAFISPLTFPRFDDHPDENEEWRYRARRRSKEMRRRRSRSGRRDSYASRGTRATATTDSNYGGSSRTGAEEDFFRDDPFRGF
ncbi:hypothetical protein DL766_000054 [Monosporascus sp. MC13-8B]|uniref:Pleckstrin homology domain-containing protein n=1 Tax=Monosporascus cannonballus TaxID=155416 RepID=A0ABY0GZ30_9PEZI|nr:hypothetical protein DL762_008585 [Monosporascus cannonballus]RYO83315.1 hypothetical protein DL763_007912 [Monosporascus cannonballus]RYP40030.1 hypothetical protein DL766_000054 [Monosporascus sp. MC13-8B]